MPGPEWLRMVLLSMGISWLVIGVGCVRLLGVDKGMNLVVILAGVWGATLSIVVFLRGIPRA